VFEHEKTRVFRPCRAAVMAIVRESCVTAGRDVAAISPGVRAIRQGAGRWVNETSDARAY